MALFKNIFAGLLNSHEKYFLPPNYDEYIKCDPREHIDLSVIHWGSLSELEFSHGPLKDSGDINT